MKEKRYKIKTIEDITDVITEDNLEYFLKDFKNFLESYLFAKQLINSLEEDEGVKKSEKIASSFTWIDDKKHDAKIIFHGVDDKKG